MSSRMMNVCWGKEDDENINYNTGEPEEIILRHASSKAVFNKNILCDNTDLIKKIWLPEIPRQVYFNYLNVF